MLTFSQYAYCSIDDTVEHIRHKIPGGIRGCGVFNIVDLCSNDCLSNYKREKQCQVCKCLDYGSKNYFKITIRLNLRLINRKFIFLHRYIGTSFLRLNHSGR